MEAEVLQRWYQQSLFGDNRIAGFTKCDRTNREMFVAISAYGGCYVGVQLPDSAQQQFADGQPWTVVDGAQIEGGHCVLFVGYDAQWLYAVTWGGIVKVSYRWWHQYGDEAWAVIPQAFVEKSKGPTLDIASLRADLDALE